MHTDLEETAREFDKLSPDEKRRVLRERSEIVYREVLEFISKINGAYEATKKSTLRFGYCYGV